MLNCNIGVKFKIIILGFDNPFQTLIQFLLLIPDESKIPNYATAARSNSIFEQLSHRRAQGIVGPENQPHL